MSIEFSAIFENHLSEPGVARVIAYISSRTRFKVSRKSDFDFGLIDDTGNSTGSNPELITVSITMNHAYIAFHACRRSDRNSFMGIAKDAFAMEGIRADFEEL